jgi:hypothetical protein
MNQCTGRTDHGDGVRAGLCASLLAAHSTVTLDRDFMQTVNTELDYHVFLTPRGDCKGLYIGQQTPSSFEVHELGGGTSEIRFDYRIMALREEVRERALRRPYQRS